MKSTKDTITMETIAITTPLGGLTSTNPGMNSVFIVAIVAIIVIVSSFRRRKAKRDV